MVQWINVRECGLKSDDVTPIMRIKEGWIRMLIETGIVMTIFNQVYHCVTLRDRAVYTVAMAARVMGKC